MERVLVRECRYWEAVFPSSQSWTCHPESPWGVRRRLAFLFSQRAQHQRQEGTERGTRGRQDLHLPQRPGADGPRGSSLAFRLGAVPRVNEDGDSQPRPHHVKELLMAYSISLTFMVILKPKW